MIVEKGNKSEKGAWTGRDKLGFWILGSEDQGENHLPNLILIEGKTEQKEHQRGEPL